MSDGNGNNEKLATRLKRGTIQIFIWTFAWLVSTALLAFGPKLLWDYDSAITWLVIISNFALGIKMLLVNKRHFEDMDELQRKIHFNAMAVSLGLTMISGCLYGLLEPAGILAETPQPSNLLFVMGISYILSVFLNARKYA